MRLPVTRILCQDIPKTHESASRVLYFLPTTGVEKYVLIPANLYGLVIILNIYITCLLYVHFIAFNFTVLIEPPVQVPKSF
jgi:hypothetical protein